MKHPWIVLILGVLLSRKVDGFSCPGIGRFENEYDPKCQTYYLCGETATLYKCPNEEVFDPNTKTCSDAYTCTKPVFNCASSGYHADLGDTSCTSYYNCFNFFGFYFKFAQHCLAGEQFDPVARVCSKSYDCGDYGLVSEEIVTVPTTVPTTTTTQAVEVPNVNASPLSAAYSSAATTAEFVCTAMGLFAEPNDPNCAIYYYCLPKTGGKFTRRQYRCPTFFDPETKKCSDDYACPTLVNSTISVTAEATSTEATTEATTIEATINDATTTPAALVTNEIPLVGEPEAVVSNDETILLEGSPVPETSSGGVTNTTINKLLEEISTTVLDNTATVSPEFECTATGRYANSLDPTCTEYFLCSKLHNGTFLRTPYTCPASSYFDPSVRRCSKTFSCAPIETTTEYITTTTTTEDVMTTVVENEVTTEFSIDFICTSTGRYPDLSDFTCKKYFLCSKLSNGTFLKTPYSCPVSNFDPINRICSKSYVCPYTTETTVQTTETILETTTEGIWDFSCYKVGRFRNLNEPSCKSYFLCNQLRNGTFIQTEYDCPTTSIFDRSIHMCSTQISCM